jgi:CoA-transferase family III
MDDAQPCPVLQFAASGAMWLTGPDDAAPVAVLAPVVPWAQRVADGIAERSARVGRRVEIDVPAVLTARAAARGFRRHGSISPNGSCRLIRSADGWVAVNLARPADVELLPAVIGPVTGDPWAAITTAATGLTGIELAERAQLVGVPVAVVAKTPGRVTPTPPGMVPADREPTIWGTPDESPPGERGPVVASRLGPSADRSQRTGRPIVVVDFSAMWAGPLCAWILGLLGANVTKVEDPARPDAARVGDPWLFERLHVGQQVVHVSFSDVARRDRLRAVVSDADVVVESSRPRALAQLGFDPAEFLAARPGRTWVSVTGYGRDEPLANRVAFGDDAAAAGGLVGWSAPGTPVFCADAVADPLSGLCGAFGALASIVAGGGHLVDVSMSAVSAAVTNAPRCPAAHPVTCHRSDGWRVAHGTGTSVPVAPPAARELGRSAS